MSINKDQVNGRLEEAAGSVQEVLGKVVGDKALEVKGNIQKNVGAIRATLGDAKEDIAKAAKSALTTTQNWCADASVAPSAGTNPLKNP